MASMTARGFCAVAALSRYTNFLPRISRERMGKSRRIFSTSNPVPTTCSRWAADSLDGILAAVVIRSPRRSFRYLRWMSRLRRCSPNLPLAADNCESIFQLARVRDLASYGPGTRSRKQRAGAGVLHQHVVIEVLLAIADEEAINQALSAFSSQYGMDVVAHQSSAKKYRV